MNKPRSEKEFNLCELFDIHTPTRKFNANEVRFGGLHPYVARGSSNNGIRGYITEDVKYLNPAKTLSFGQDTATIYYQDKPYFTGDKIKIMELKGHELTESIALYLLPVIRKAFSGFAWGQSSFNESVLNNTKIILPVTETESPDWEYMQERIAELEQERIAELEQERIAELDAYLTATGLDSLDLTDDEKTALDRMANERIHWKAFRIGDLFEKLDSDYYGSGARHSDISDDKTDEYCVPVTTAKKGNNGICRWAKEGQFKTYKNVISIVYNGAIAAGLTYYQPYPVSALTDSYIIDLKNGELNEQSGIYLACAIQKVTKAKFSREKKAVWNRVKEEYISLPVNKTGQPDLEYMTTFISAQQKLAIADVVEWKDKEIAATKAIIA